MVIIYVFTSGAHYHPDKNEHAGPQDQLPHTDNLGIL
jgi:hypothetical protein